MNKWETYDLERKLKKILSKEKYKPDPEHHLGRPFLSAYQLAIEFAKTYPHEFEEIGLPIGGKGIGRKKTLAQEIAKRLSQGIKNGTITGIEGGFFSHENLKEMTFKYDDGEIISSLTTGKGDLSMFRMIDNPVERSSNIIMLR
ncbi:MAG: hypothetical protein Q4F66_13215 [Clostridium sp.]|nr:hypothetical protein [Clostridium sp.]